MISCPTTTAKTSNRVPLSISFGGLNILPVPPRKPVVTSTRSSRPLAITIRSHGHDGLRARKTAWPRRSKSHPTASSDTAPVVALDIPLGLRGLLPLYACRQTAAQHSREQYLAWRLRLASTIGPLQFRQNVTSCLSIPHYSPILRIWQGFCGRAAAA